MAHPPTRLLICVDDISSKGPTDSFYGTNVHLIYSSIQRGICTNTVSGETYNQAAEYAPWLSHTDDVVFNKERLQAGVLGQGYVQRVEEIYNRCSQLLPARDEVWLFGSGRGATVVRAVAGLLHSFGAMASAGRPGFGEDFKRMLKHMQRTSDPASSATASTVASTRPPPRIQFVGAFDPIRCKYDEMFDTSFNRSISHIRQAFALHEDKESLSPALLFPEDLNDLALKDCGQSFVQAYFVGRHNDIAGSAKTCGLALYPCQWMWLEARQCGLVINMTEEASGEHESLFALLPEPAKKEGKKQKAELWSFTSENGITARMQDLRTIHRLSGDREGMYTVRLVSPWLSSISERSRDLRSTPTETSEATVNGHHRGQSFTPQSIFF